MTFKNKIQIFPILNLLQNFFSPSKRVYRYYSNSQRNTFTAPTRRQLKRLKVTIESPIIKKYFNNIDRLCLKTDGNIILDIGTNIGYWSYAFSKSKDPEREVIGFEPDLRNLSMAASNLAKRKRVSIFNMGLSDTFGRFSVSIPTEGKKRKYEGKFNTGLMTALNNDNSKGTYFIRGEKLLEMLNIPFNSIACIKIDVEGFEYKVLKGIATILDKAKPLLIIEINPVTMSKANYSFKELFLFLSELGYICLIEEKLNIKINNSQPSGAFNMLAVKEFLRHDACKLMNAKEVIL